MNGMKLGAYKLLREKILLCWAAENIMTIPEGKNGDQD
jgi:hypothetical protein